jgi:hypothetical protein
MVNNKLTTMKKLLIITVVLLFIANTTGAQTISTEADQLANHIANKMKDSLGLSTEERDLVYQKNVLVFFRKDSVRQIHPIGSDSLRIKLQSIERRRDTLYRPILGEERFQLYLQKKNNLISAN